MKSLLGAVVGLAGIMQKIYIEVNANCLTSNKNYFHIKSCKNDKYNIDHLL